MANLNVSAKENNQVNEEKPPPRVCPRCDSDNTKFCYYNNYSQSQPRYFCKKCRRYWTHGGALRDIPIGGRCRTPKRPRIEQSSVSLMVSIENHQPGNNHQPLRHVQENSRFLGSFGGSSTSSVATSIVGNQFGYMTEVHSVSVTNVPPGRSFRPILLERLDFGEEPYQQGFYDVGTNDLIGNPFINQSIGEYVDNLNSYGINQSSFNNTMNGSHEASSSGSRGSSGTEMNNDDNKKKIGSNFFFRSA
ncbi:hypothetical protein CARUB_v10006458mg [Capsella rubella]|uniref:Dof zinc finger protein n=1 Tax=Capsella rubella TaxID=81985 RepID=R0GX21_9BRAS|nr:dof zinc finger protein DOF4.4 isoform X1 [Capsella rubella]EOA15703.1 hypothetical protein CARUB_v10006458mg [Capsella rubella]